MLSREKLEKYKKDEMMECMRESVDVLMMEKNTMPMPMQNEVRMREKEAEARVWYLSSYHIDTDTKVRTRVVILRWYPAMTMTYRRRQWDWKGMEEIGLGWESDANNLLVLFWCAQRSWWCGGRRSLWWWGGGWRGIRARRFERWSCGNRLGDGPCAGLDEWPWADRRNNASGGDKSFVVGEEVGFSDAKFEVEDIKELALNTAYVTLAEDTGTECPVDVL
jgi:hypothetical protein